ncbi:MAG: hypothetical protein K5989_05655 [Lachnospiraceae bacterium]|nr:hypothetical protein [Lachnospiraceae bacterium]
MIVSLFGRKIREKKGITRAAVLLLIVIAILIVLLLIPVVMHYVSDLNEIGCTAGLKSAKDQVAIGVNFKGTEYSAEEVKRVVTHAMVGWDDLCPSYGTIYVIPSNVNGTPDFTLVCGIHDKDTKQRTRLNASYVLDQIRAILGEGDLSQKTYPDGVNVKLNGETIRVTPVKSELGLKRGTNATTGYEGRIIHYMVTTSGSSSKQRSELVYFVYADEDHAAVWRKDDGWTGDSYEGFSGSE